jgi:hypothetical protein
MKPTLARLLTRLYPRAWRDRYGEEFEALLEMGRGDFRTLANSVWSAACEHIFPTQGGNMDRDPRSFGAIVRQPSAFLPLAMSLTALAILLGHIALYGLAPEAVVGGRPDEGAVAHIWQLLMAGQLPVLAFFAIKWLPRALKPALGVLALQVGAVLAAMAPVFFLNL